jgi:hypothetical protein
MPGVEKKRDVKIMSTLCEFCIENGQLKPKAKQNLHYGPIS